jgi:radical SAM superfamily enzyme YgiQ (UPF0313 family)
MKNILLINPCYELEIRWIVGEDEIDVKADYLPLHLGTVAALTPKDRFHVDIWDELVRGPLLRDDQLDKKYDLVGMTSLRVNLDRAQQISNFFRERGVPVVIGGPGVSGTPDKCQGKFDVLFIGEAELTWPQFLEEWEAGTHKKEYRQIEKPDVSESPLPDWSSLERDLPRYAMGALQSTRGCPFDCEFCDVIYLNGRRQRHKPVERVMEEVKALQRLGMKTVFFNDDNFVGNRKYAKDVLRALIPLNNSFPQPLRFATQASIDCSKDPELLELLADANFYQMLVGIESPNPESLKEACKYQNLTGDLVEQVHTILSYGIVVRGGMIVGFDHDGPDIFERQYEFIQKACLPSISMHMLNAPMGTRLWRRLRTEGRVADVFKVTGQLTQRIFNNVIPKQMTRVQLMQGFHDLYEKLFTWDSIRGRILGWMSLIQRAPNVRPSNVASAATLDKLVTALKLDAEARAAIDEMFRVTAEKAPFMQDRVREMIIQFIRYGRSARSLLPKLRKQIELESTGQLTFELDARPVPVTEAFRQAFRFVFADIHRRIYLNLSDKDLVPKALVEVFMDFLLHEKNCNEVEPHHPDLLAELADRTCALFNGQAPEDFVPAADDGRPVPDPKKARLWDDVCMSVDQELVKLAASAAPAAKAS